MVKKIMSSEDKAAKRFFERKYSGESRESIIHNIENQAGKGVVYIPLELGDLDENEGMTRRGYEKVSAYIVTAKSIGYLTGQSKICVSSDQIALYTVHSKKLKRIAEEFNFPKGNFRICLDDLIPGSCVNEKQRTNGVLSILERCLFKEGCKILDSVTDGNYISISYAEI